MAEKDGKVRALILTALLICSAFGATVMFTGVASADTLVVDKTNSSAYDSIRNAVDNASDGDTVNVTSGTYTEPVDIRKNITLVAPNGATIENTSIAPSPRITYRAGIQVFGPTTPTIEGFTIEGWTWGFSAGASEGAWELRDTVIRDNRLAVGAAGTPAPWTVDNVTVVNSTGGLSAYQSSGDWSIRDSTFRGGNSDIFAEESSGNWTVERTTIRNITDGAIDAENSSGQWTVQDSVFENTTDDGVNAEEASSDWVLDNVTARDIGDDAVDAVNSSGSATVRDTVVSDVEDGIEFDRSGGTWTIEDSIIENTTGDGIDAFEIESEVTIDNVTISDASNGVNLYNSSGPWSIEDSVIENVTLTAVNAGNSDGEWEIHHSILTNDTNATGDALGAFNAQIKGNATYNYWGAPDGPGGDFGGSGGDAVGNVSVDPYYTDAALTSLNSGETVSGAILTGDGTPATNDFVTANPVDTGERDLSGLVVNQTSDAGAFSLNVESGREYDIRVFQFDESAGTLGVDDGAVDVYAVDRRSFSNDIDYGEITLPDGYEVNFTVVDEAGNPVEDANVSIVHTNDTEGATAALVDSPTTATGQMVAKAIPNLGVAQSTVPGLELAGNVTVSVAPPPGSPLNANTTELSVDSDREVAIALDDPRITVDSTVGSGDYDTIQEAVNNADEGDTIVVDDGMYWGVRIDKPGVTVRAADGATPVIEGPETIREQSASVAFGPSSPTGPFQRTTRPVTRMGAIGELIISDQSAVVVTENDTTIEGFEIRNAGTTGIVIGERVDGVTIQGNVIKDLTATPVGELDGEQTGLESFWGLDTGPSERDSLSGLDGGSAARDSLRQLGAINIPRNTVTGIDIRPGDHSDLTITDNRIESLPQSGSEGSTGPVDVRGILAEDGTLSNSIISNNVIRDLQSDTGSSVGILILADTESLSLAANKISNVRSVGEDGLESYAAGIQLREEVGSITDTDITGNDLSGVTNGNDLFPGVDITIESANADSSLQIRQNRLQSNIGLFYSRSASPSVKCNYWGGSLGPVEISEFNEDGTVNLTDDNVQPAAESVNLDNRVRSAVTDNVEFRPFLTEDPASVAEPNCGARAPVPLELSVGNTPITAGDFPNFELTETMSGDQVNGKINLVGGPTEPTGSDGLVSFQVEDEGTVTVIATKESSSRKNFQADEITLDVASGGSGTTGGDGGDGILDEGEDGPPAPSTPEAPSTPGGTPAEGTSDDGDGDTAGQDSDLGSTPESQQDQGTTPEQAATPQSDVTTPDQEQEPGGFGGSTALIAVLLLLVAGAAGAYYLRRRQ